MSLDDWVKLPPHGDQGSESMPVVPPYKGPVFAGHKTTDTDAVNQSDLLHRSKVLDPDFGHKKSGVIGCYEQLYGKPDPVNSPSHYTAGGLEPIDMIEAKQLGYHLGNALKYICRCQFKGDRKTDVKKAIWYLERYLKTIETEQ